MDAQTRFPFFVLLLACLSVLIGSCGEPTPTNDGPSGPITPVTPVPADNPLDFQTVFRVESSSICSKPSKMFANGHPYEDSTDPDAKFVKLHWNVDNTVDSILVELHDKRSTPTLMDSWIIQAGDTLVVDSLSINKAIGRDYFCKYQSICDDGIVSIIVADDLIKL